MSFMVQKKNHLCQQTQQIQSSLVEKNKETMRLLALVLNTPERSSVRRSHVLGKSCDIVVAIQRNIMTYRRVLLMDFQEELYLDVDF